MKDTGKNVDIFKESVEKYTGNRGKKKTSKYIGYIKIDYFPLKNFNKFKNFLTQNWKAIFFTS